MSAIRLFDDIDPVAPRTASAKQIRYALNDLGIRGAWETAAGPGKATQAMQDWWGWTDPFVENAPKLAKLIAAVNAAQASANPPSPPLTAAALFDKAVTE